LPTEDLFVCVHVLVDDAISGGGREHRGPAGPGSACSDAELLTVALVRALHGVLSGRRPDSVAGPPVQASR